MKNKNNKTGCSLTSPSLKASEFFAQLDKLMKTIEIRYTRKITFNKIIEVNDKVAKEALKLDGEDISKPRWFPDKNKGFLLLTENLVDETKDIFDSAGEIEDVSVRIYKPKK